MSDLAELRSAIDALDRDLLACLKRRFALTDEVAAVKRATGKPVFDAHREAQILAQVAEVGGPNLGQDLATVYAAILEASKRRQAMLLNHDQPAVS